MTTTTENTVTTRSSVAGWIAGLFGLAVVLVVLQGLWAGLFIDKEGADAWVWVHARGAEASILAAGVASVLALWKLRAQRALWLGGGAFTVLLVLIAFIGGLITDNSLDSLIPVHVPLAMASLLLGTWLTVKAVRLRKS